MEQRGDEATQILDGQGGRCSCQERPLDEAIFPLCRHAKPVSDFSAELHTHLPLNTRDF